MNRVTTHHSLFTMTCPPPTGNESVYTKLTRFCFFQERCTTDISRKLQEWKIPQPEAIRLIRQLKRDGFLDERRFAGIYARGKFREKKWGKVRIRHELLKRDIPTAMICEALGEIDEEEYLRTIRNLIRRKKKEIPAKKTLNIREKILNFVVGKGFESDMVLRVLNELQIEDGD